ncbi:hypothetical protein [Streptomyces orinoci]|uniref:Uncharacterized protein n=1 Tax=Streptomyces orinoci TaxID=67339 RepID=A0ABV3K1Q6_STRON|nr:hypothetical protein [Streptomyces orinoci]
MSTVKTAPGLAFLAEITHMYGMYYGDAGPVAQLLMTHTPPRRLGETFEWIDAGMRALASCLGLGPILQDPPYVGSRLLLHAGVVSLDYGERWWLCIPETRQEWQRHIAEGGPVRLIVSAEPAAASSTQEEMAEHLAAGAAAGTAWWGTTSLRRRSNLH